MHKFNRVLVNGCSFSRGPDSWPYHLQKIYNFDLVNLAQAGAGNTYIHESTMEEISHRSYDFVIIMWSGLSRIDYKVEDIGLFEKSSYTSKFQKTRNDWKEKSIIPVNDQDYVDDSWVFGCGFLNNDQTIISSDLFAGIYKHIGYKQFIYHALIKMLSLQSFLKANQIPYLFTFFNEYQNDLAIYPVLYNALDQKNMLISKNIHTIAHQFNDIDDTKHPGYRTHKQWAEVIREHFNEK